MPYMIWSSGLRLMSPPLTASTMKPKYSIASQPKPRRYADSAGVGRSPVVVRPPRRVFDRADGQEVLYGHPSRGRLPGSFQHHLPGEVPALPRHLRRGGAEPEGTGAPVEQRREHAGGVGAGQAEPLDGAVGRDQAAPLAVGREPVSGNRRKCGRPCLPRLAFKAVCPDSEWIVAIRRAC